jgi:hypothetical protein
LAPSKEIRVPIQVRGKPLSQSIIEERRWTRVGVYYFDTSALVKRYTEEAGTGWVMTVTDPAAGSDIYTVSITAPEMIAALFRKVRLQDLAQTDAARAASYFKADFAQQY